VPSPLMRYTVTLLGLLFGGKQKLAGAVDARVDGRDGRDCGSP